MKPQSRTRRVALDSFEAETAIPIKGRGTSWAIEHRFTTAAHEAFDDGWGTLDQCVETGTVAPATEIIEQHVKSIISSNDSPDISFDLTINPYRGSEHGRV
jgi:hypothetical protein